MQISELALRLLLLFFPGIICLYIVDALTVHRERQAHDSLIRGFVYGILSYACYAAILTGLNWNEARLGVKFRDEISITKALTTAKCQLDIEEIAWVTLVAIGVGLLLSCAISHEWLHACATKTGISRKFGHLNVWQRAFSAEETKWVTFRDMDSNKMFAGRVRAFSDVEEVAELFLTDVIVYNETTGAELYRADHMYLARPKDKLTVEIPNPPPIRADNSAAANEDSAASGKKPRRFRRRKNGNG